jgi:hypothetical protein
MILPEKEMRFVFEGFVPYLKAHATPNWCPFCDLENKNAQKERLDVDAEEQSGV